MHMFIMNVYDDVLKPTLGEDTPKYAPWLLTCFFFIFFANLMGLVPFPPGGGNLTGNITCTFFLGVCTLPNDQFYRNRRNIGKKSFGLMYLYG